MMRKVISQEASKAIPLEAATQHAESRKAEKRKASEVEDTAVLPQGNKKVLTEGTAHLALDKPLEVTHPYQFPLPGRLKKTEIKEFFDKLGQDVFSDQPFYDLASEAYENACPYIFAELQLESQSEQGEKYVAYADAANLYSKIFLFTFEDKIRVKKEMLADRGEEVSDIVFWSTTPWSLNPVMLGSFEDIISEKSSGLFAKFVLSLRDSEKSEIESYYIRGTAFLMFNYGVVVDKDLNTASFLLSELDEKQRKRVFTETLSMAAQHYAPPLVKACLRYGGDPTPAYASDNFLALTLAVIGAQTENIKILLAAGADPRQQADYGHEQL